jgi:hypothetical protein
MPQNVSSGGFNAGRPDVGASSPPAAAPAARGTCPREGQPDVLRHHAKAGLLSQRSFRLLWIGETVSQVGNAMALVGVPLVAVLLLHASVFAVSLLTASAWLPWLVLGLPAGAWVDRLPVRPLMITWPGRPACSS